FDGEPNCPSDDRCDTEDAGYYPVRFHSFVSLRPRRTWFVRRPFYSLGKTMKSPSRNSLVKVTPPNRYSTVRCFTCPNSGSPLRLLLAIALRLSPRTLPLSSSVTSNLAFSVQYSALRICKRGSVEADPF